MTKSPILVPLTQQTDDKNLRSSELRYRRLFEAAQDGILILDGISGKITDANPFIIKILGYSLIELLGRELWQIGVFGDINASKAAFAELKNKGYIRYSDLPLKQKNGSKIAVEFVSNVYKVAEQTVIQCNIRDISARKKAESALTARTKDLEELSRAQEETRKAILNVMEDLENAKNVIELEKAKDEAMLASIGEGLIAVNNDKKVIIINKSAENLLGWKQKDLLGKNIASLVIEDEEGNILPMYKNPNHFVLNTSNLTSNTFYFVRKNKTKFPVAINVTPIKLAKKTMGAIYIFRNITREKEIDRAKTEFVSLASHQLRSPLGISKWYLEALMTDGYLENTSDVAKDYLNEVYKSNERLLVIVRGLLSISQIDQGKIRNTPASVDITALVKDIVKSMRVIGAKKNIKLHLDVKNSNIPSFFVDSLRLQEMLENLIANGIDYSNSGSTVNIIIDKEKNNLLISVSDTGIGISPKDKKKLFIRFYRSEKAVQKNTEGSGLGLYVVKSYVDGWGGKIYVESIENKGSTFTVTLPIKNK